MFAMRLIQAEEGDCFLLHYGTAAKPRHLLVDGGPSDIYDDHLAPTLKSHVKGRTLDLAICSHADSDHTLGLVDLFAELKADLDAGDTPRVKPAALWHNSFADTLGATLAAQTQSMLETVQAHGLSMTSTQAEVMGIADGRALRRFALLTSTPLNPQSGGAPVVHDGAAPRFAFGNLTLTVLGPMPQQLAALRIEWAQWLQDNAQLIANGQVNLAANSDRSARNLSSIQVLAEVDGKRMLLTGDGLSSHLLEGLDHAGLLDASGNIHVNLLKLAHHGSDRNVTKTFFKKVTADIYVASGNGKNGNPDYKTLKWLIEVLNSQNRTAEIVVTNRTSEVDRIRQEFPPSSSGYKIRWLRSNWHSTKIVLD